ncbi:hypothetical protein PAMP_004616 [Pampus punctatissimus]
MAAPFVPAPFSVDRTAAYRSWIKTGFPPIYTTASSTIPESFLWVRGAGSWSTADESQSRPQGGVLDGSPSQLKGDGELRESWVERPIAPTLLGYEILEDRAKFTVYKILVSGGKADSWVIFRRYTDFCRLNDKLKELFPGLCLALPPKRWFKDNYDEEFLEERQIGLQTFLQNLTAFCETLEETYHRLQRELLEKQKEVDILKKTLEERENHISLLAKKVKALALPLESFEHLSELPATAVRDTHREGDTDGTD